MKTLIAAASVLLLLSSCKTYDYLPHNHQIPTLKEKGDVEVQAGGGKTDQVTSLGASANYALSNKLFISGGFMQTNSGSVKFDALGFKFNQYTIGGGYFKPIGKNSTFAIQAGFARLNYQHSAYSPTFSFNRNKFFIEPTFAYQGKYLGFGVATRLSYVKTPAITFPGSQPPYSLDYLNTNRSVWLFEPAFQLSGRYNNFKLTTEFGFGTPLGNQSLNVLGYHTSVTLNYTFNRKQLKRLF